MRVDNRVCLLQIPALSLVVIEDDLFCYLFCPGKIINYNGFQREILGKGIAYLDSDFRIIVELTG